MTLILQLTDPSAELVSRPTSAATVTLVAPAIAGTRETDTQRPRLVVLLDPASGATALHSEIIRLARNLAAEVILLRALRPPAITSFQAGDDLMPPVNLLERQAEAELREYEPLFGSLPVRSVVLVGANPGQEIKRWLREEPADLVVAVTPRPGKLPRWLANPIGRIAGHPGPVWDLAG